jgi:hypothetical protein
MTNQGERARALGSAKGRFFDFSKVRIAVGGHVGNVLWGEVDTASDHDIGTRVVAMAADVVDAIHEGAQVAAARSSSTPGEPEHRPERMFVIVEHRDGRECITREDPQSPGRDPVDMVKLDDRRGMIGFEDAGRGVQHDAMPAFGC